MSPLHHLRLIMAFALLISPAYAQNFPYATDTFKNNELQHWSLEEVRAYRDKVIGDLTDKKTIPEKDNAACSALLGYWSKQVEGKRDEHQDNTNGDDPEAVIFKTELDLTAHDGLVNFALQVDDEAILTVTEILTGAESTGHTPIAETYEVKGTALWRVDRSYKEFSNSIPAGRKYDLRLNYLNTANLTDKYDGLVDYDGVNVFLLHHPAVDLDVDSNNTEGFEFTWGDDKEDKIEASATEPGKIIAVPIEPDADKDSIPDYMDFGGISSDPKKQFVQMVVHLPPNYDPETATVTFHYPMSETTNSSSTQPPNSGFRIWTRNGHVSRSLDAIPVAPPVAPDPAPGYLVKDGDSILWKNLAANCDGAEAGRYPGPALILYLETVITYKGGSLSTSEPEQIKVTAKNGSTSDESKTEDVVNITVRCTGGVKISGPKAIMVNDNHDNLDVSGNQMDQWDKDNDQTGTLDKDVKSISVTVVALDQPVTVIVSSDQIFSDAVPTPAGTGGLIDGIFPGQATIPPSTKIGTSTNIDGQSKKGWLKPTHTINVPAGTTVVQELFIEGLRNSATVDDVVIKSKTTGKDIITGDPKTCIATTESEHKMTVYQVDLDIDSNNDSGFTLAAGTDEEDQIEVSESLSGKIITSSPLVDTNSDGIPDYENGVDGNAINPDANFVPIKITLKEPYDVLTTEITLKYDEAKILTSESRSGLRFWLKKATEQRKTSHDLISSEKPVLWSKLFEPSESPLREVTLYIETINIGSVPILGEKQILVTAKQQEMTESTDKVDAMFFYCNIEKVISDQIAGNECNSLPTKYYQDQPNNPMLMATRSGNYARLQIMADVPSMFIGRAMVGVRAVDNPSVIIGSTKIFYSNAKTPLNFNAQNGSLRYEIVTGYDSNSDAILSINEVAGIFQKTPKIDAAGHTYTGGDTKFENLDKIIIVTEADFIESRDEINNYFGSVFAKAYPEGDKLMNAFGTGSTSIVGAATSWGYDLDANIIPSAQGLSHPLGGIWNSVNKDTTFKFIYPSSSDLSQKVIESKGIEKLLDRIIIANKSSLLASATITVSTSSWYPFADDEIAFGKSDPYEEVHLALGKCKALGELIIKYRGVAGGKIEVHEVRCNGKIEDLYDWAYGTKLVVPLIRADVDVAKYGARTQAGHATLAKSTAWPSAGRVFFDEVNFDTGWIDWENKIY